METAPCSPSLPAATTAPTVVIAGGSGFLGRSMSAHLSRAGWNVTILSRSAPPWREHPPRGVTHVPWDAHTLGPWTAALNSASALINLCGRTVDCTKTPDHCDEILRSRVQSTLTLGTALREIPSPPPVWVQMSTAHIYGDPPSTVCDDDSPTGYGLAPTVGKAWEEAFHASVPPSARGVIMRTTFVLGKEGGALRRLVPLARLGLGGTVGTGTQGMSWIHEHDLNRLFERALVDPSMQGVYVITAPTPLSNRDFMRELRRAVRMPIGLPAPTFLVKLAARYILRTDPELALYGRYIIPTRLLSEGFTFRFPTLPEALQDICR